MEQQVMEQWKQIPGYPHEVSDMGRVRRMYPEGPRIITSQLNRFTGHAFVNLCRKSLRGRTLSIRALVAAAFLPPRQPGEYLQFRNGDKADCRVANLFFKPKSEIIKASFLAGRRKPPGTMKYLDARDYKEIKRLWATGEYSQIELGRKFSCLNSTISKIVNGLSKPRVRKPKPQETPHADGNTAGTSANPPSGMATES